MVIDEQVRTTDIGVAEALIARVYRRADIIDTGDPFDFEQTIRGDERAKVSRYRISSRMDATVEVDGIVTFGSLVSGSYRAASNGVGIDPGSAFVLEPGETSSSSEGLDLAIVHLDVSALRAAAGAPDRRSGGLRLGSLAPVTVASQQQWEVTRRFAFDTLNDPELLRQDLIRRSVTDLLLANALVCFAIDVGPLPRTDDGRPATVRRAVQFIEDNASRAIGVQEIAEAARMSARGLQDVFRRILGTSPMGYLRTVRLDGARHELLQAVAGEQSVAEIAARWGFAHVGRFASRYRIEFGEYPAQTLRR